MIRVGKCVIFPSCQINRLGFFYKEFPPDWILCWYKGSAGTVAMSCKKLKRNYIGSEISPEYCKIAEERIKSISNPLFK